MATRNIARTAIEGGRAGFCRDAEHDADEREARRWRDYCHKAVLDPEIDEPYDNGCRNWDLGRKGREFNDRLNPVRRWLASRVGRRWDDVMSEVTKKFDRRSLAGRHILDHVEGYVTTAHDLEVGRMRYTRVGHSSKPWYYPGEMYVDEEGILRKEPEKAR